jgi:tetratricopeptide (TPR) repeat protein
MPIGNSPADAVRTIYRRGGGVVMQERRWQTFVFTLAMAVCAALTIAWQSAQAESARLGKLGTVNFPTSAPSEEAQAHFLRGVAALHSFWYPVALDEFGAATSIEPDFMMGYWGEAMTHNHPLWGEPQETEAARKVIEKIKDTSHLTPIERAYLHAVKVLYGEGEKPARDRAYAAAMEQIHRDYPEDAEAALFYALALMATVHPEDPAGEPTRLRAGEIASAIYAKYPDHPGAAHYVIHAYDDPQNAPKALDAARRYAAIAPAAPHALHMPSHIFLQLGMWQEAAASNEAAWAASEQWVKQKHLPISQRDCHDLHWLLYIYLQQGRYSQAEARLGLMRESLPAFSKDDPRNLAYGTFTLASMAASFLVETEQWDRAESLLPPPASTGDARKQTGGGSNPYQAYAVLAEIPAIFARGLAAAAHGSPEAQKSVAALQTIRDKSANVPVPEIAHMVKMTEVQELEIAAMSQAAKSDFEGAMQTLRRATALEEAMPSPHGPPVLVKPSHELLGEILLRAGRPQEAAEQFATALRRHKNRARSLLGAARAAARSGDTQGAAHTYAQFSQQWQQADTQLPELREARDYSQQTRVR